MKKSKSTMRSVVMTLIVVLGLGFAGPILAEIKWMVQSYRPRFYLWSVGAKCVEMAVDEINSAGGINGSKINLIIRDDKGDATEAISLVIW